MSLIAGWVGTGIRGNDAQRLLHQYLVTAPHYTQQSVDVQSHAFYTLAAEPQRLALQRDRVVINAGQGELSTSVEQLVNNYLQSGFNFLDNIKD